MERKLLPALLCTLLSACSTEPATLAASGPGPSAAPPPATVARPVAAVSSEEAERARILKLLVAKSIYFDYDNFAVKQEYQAVLKQDSDALKTAPRMSIRLEGNADERGSTEYNLALGQKRAEAVRRSLELMGLPGAQIEAISYGKEKPRAACHDEKCWAENRRVDFADKSK